MRNIQLTISTVLAFFAVAMMIRAAGVDPAIADPGAAAAAMPTPYSAAHAEVQSRPGPAEEMPPTF
jgi:hypothetical protein